MTLREGVSQAEEVPVGLMWARQRKCLGPENPCPRHRVCRGWQWPRCQAGPCEGDGTPLLEITREFLRGPESGCPEGSWAGLRPVNMERPPVSPQMLEEAVDRYCNQHDPLMDRVPAEELKQALIEMVERGFSLPLAKGIATKKGLKLDDDIPPAS